MGKIKDLTGQRFGKLTAIEQAYIVKGQGVIWLCQCDCGNTCKVLSSNLIRGHSQSCGCLQRKPSSKSGNIKDLTGQRFGRLTVIELTDQRKGKEFVWRCRCDCGNERLVCGAYLRNGTTRSCGCLRSETNARNKFLDLTGQKFGKLTVLEKTDRRLYDQVVWRCRCDCGNLTEVSSGNLRRGGTTSCGCSRGKSKKRGIRWNKNEKKWLVCFDTYEDAVKARDFIDSEKGNMCNDR